MENKKYSKINTLDMMMKADPKLIKKFLFNKIKSDDALGKELYAFLEGLVPTEPAPNEFEKIVNQDIKDIKDALNKPLRGHSSVVYKSDSYLDKLVNKSLKRIRTQAPTITLRVKCQLDIIALIGLTDNINLCDEAYDQMLNSIVEDFREIYRGDEAEDDVELFETCLKFLSDDRLFGFGAEEIERFILKSYAGDFPKEVRNYVTGRIKKIVSKGYLDRKLKYELGEYVSVLLNIMSQQGASERELLDFAKDFSDNYSVQSWFLKYYKRREEWEKAIQVIEEGLIPDKENSSLVSLFKLELKDLYRLSGQTDKYKEMLLSMIKESKGEIVSELKELKSLLPPELWEEQFETILEWKKDDKEIVAQSLFEVGSIERLAEFVLSPETELPLLEQYVLILPEQYNERIYKTYERVFNQLASSASTPTDYLWLLENLSCAHKIINGKELILKLLSQWLDEYKDKPDFLEHIILFISKYMSRD